MKYVYYIKALAYFMGIYYFDNTDGKIGCAGLAVLMLFFATQLSIEDYIDKKFAEKK